MPNSAENDSNEAVLRERIASLEHEIAELRCAKRLWEQMSIIDAARIRKLERQVQDSAGAAGRARSDTGNSQKVRAGE